MMMQLTDFIVVFIETECDDDDDMFLSFFCHVFCNTCVIILQYFYTCISKRKALNAIVVICCRVTKYYAICKLLRIYVSEQFNK